MEIRKLESLNNPRVGGEAVAVVEEEEEEEEEEWFRIWDGISEDSGLEGRAPKKSH